MGDTMNSYAEFAENDYMFFRQAYDSGNKGSALAALGQSICERYLKHIVSEYAHPETNDESREKESVLHTHSLHRLMRYIHDTMGISIPEEMEDRLDRIDGFYFTTRYPGNESFIPSSRDIDKANVAVKAAREFMYEICQEMDE